MRWLVLPGVIIAAAPVVSSASALAQQAQQLGPVDRGIALALELHKLGVYAHDTAISMDSALRAAQARAAELEKLCGDPCKPRVIDK